MDIRYSVTMMSPVSQSCHRGIAISVLVEVKDEHQQDEVVVTQVLSREDRAPLHSSLKPRELAGEHKL